MMGQPLHIGLLTPACCGYNALDSGIGQHFRDLALGLVDLGHRVSVITPGSSALASPDPELSSIHFVPFPDRMPHWLDRLTGLRWQLNSLAGLRTRVSRADAALAACAERTPLHVVETTSSGVLAARYLQRHRRVPVITRVSTTGTQLVAHNIGTPSWVDRVEHRWEEKIVRASDRLLTHTKNHRDELCQLWQLAPNTLAIIPHGITLPPRQALPAIVRRDAVEILYVGRFEHRKGIDVLLETIPALLVNEPRVRFTLIGQDANGYWQRKFWTDNPRLNRESVVFAGAVSPPQLQAAYRDCDIFVAPSRYESFGLIYVEAMAWGKPAIGCRAGGIPEVIDDGRTGLLAEAGSVPSLHDLLNRLVQAPTLRVQLGAAARLRVENEFSRTTLAERSVALYREVATTGAQKLHWPHLP